MSGLTNIILAQYNVTADLTFTVTIASYGGANPTRMGFTLIGPKGSVSPSPSLFQTDQEPPETSEFWEITNYENPTNGIEMFFGSGYDPGADGTSLVSLTTFSTIEIDHSGGTVTLSTADVGSGGDLNQGASSAAAGFTDLWFPNVAKIWDLVDDGQQYEIRFYYS